MKTKILFQAFLLMTISHVASSQTIIGNPKANSLIVKKIAGSDLVVPIEVSIINTSKVAATSKVSININNNYINLINQFSDADLANIRIINNNQTMNISPGVTANSNNVFYLFIDRTVIINFDKIIYINVLDGANIISNIKITIQPEDQILTLPEYLDNTNVLDYVTKVESAGNILTVNGYRTLTDNGQTRSIFYKKNVSLENGQVFAVNEWSFVWNLKHWQPLPFAITTIPFKIRPAVTANNIVFKNNASSGISNLGFNLDLGKYQMDRYFPTGKKSNHKFSLGFWAAPQ